MSSTSIAEAYKAFSVCKCDVMSRHVVSCPVVCYTMSCERPKRPRARTSPGSLPPSAHVMGEGMALGAGSIMASSDARQLAPNGHPLTLPGSEAR